MRFFISTFAVMDEYKVDRAIEPIQQAFLQAISSSDHEYYDGSIFTDYPRIFNEIERSDILVAFIDDSWLSSTWKMRELWYAAGISPENEGHFIGSSLVCYVYCVCSKRSNVENILSCDNVRTFDGTFSDLLSKIRNT